MTTEISDMTHEEIPNNGADKLRFLARNDPETWDILFDGPYQYMEPLKARITDLWGQDELPTNQSIYQTVKELRDGEPIERPGESPTVGEVEESGAVSVAQLSAAVQEIGRPTDTIERAEHVILSDIEVALQASEEVTEEFVDEVQERVAEEYGRLYEPTEGSVREAVSRLRRKGYLPEFGEGFEEVGEPQQIVYICELCGERDPSYQAIKDHISCTDDAVHGDRSAKESHLISAEGSPIEDTHEAFGSNDFEEEFEDGFDVLWTIYTNPDARQGDVAELLDISDQTLRNRLDDLGIEWSEREEQVEEIVESAWSNGVTEDEDEDERETVTATETVTRENETGRYSGPETGVMTTSDHPPQNIGDRPAASELETEEYREETMSVEFTERELRNLLTGRDPAPAKERILNALLDTE